MEKEDEEDIIEERSSAFPLFIGVISMVIITLILIYIFIFTDWELSPRLWFSGFAAFVLAVIFYILYSSFKTKLAKLMSVAFFALCAVLFYLSVWFMPVSSGDEVKKTIGLIVLAIILILMLFILLYTRMKKERKPRVVEVKIKKRT